MNQELNGLITSSFISLQKNKNTIYYLNETVTYISYCTNKEEIFSSVLCDIFLKTPFKHIMKLNSK